MDATRAAEFDREIEHVRAAELPVALVRWALAGTEDEALFERPSRGEDTAPTSGTRPPGDKARAATDTAPPTRIDAGMRGIVAASYGAGSSSIGKSDNA
ncbi:hypothetical protein [Streptomyces sp. NPDC056730]|uniref:hypothetical protein n=1 Tax=unclassified Streptomyces TaxID=2593676 RepID=UPI003658C098